MLPRTLPLRNVLPPLSVGLALTLSMVALAPGQPARAEPAAQTPYPTGFVMLQEKVDHDGSLKIGVFGAEVDPAEQGLWRVRIWEQRRDRVTVAVDKIGCSTKAPMRITGNRRMLILQELNPGGAITPQNRLDHLIWWAICDPPQAGKDPATLGPRARQLGYPGTLSERQQILAKPGS